jgi:hypothetical protein
MRAPGTIGPPTGARCGLDASAPNDAGYFSLGKPDHRDLRSQMRPAVRRAPPAESRTPYPHFVGRAVECWYGRW